MERCPNVKGISFSPKYIDTDVYRFFATALLENRTWILDYLPAPDKSSLCFPYLWSCAYYMRNSSKELYIEDRLIGRRDFDQVLSGFKQLKTLHVGGNMLKNLFDIGSILVHLPQLKQLYVSGPQLDNSINSTDRGSSTQFRNIKYLDIKKSIWNEEELHYIVETFANLEELCLSGSFTPTSSTSAAIMSCIQLASKETNIICGELNDMGTLMDMYPIQQNQKKLNLCISFMYGLPRRSPLLFGILAAPSRDNDSTPFTKVSLQHNNASHIPPTIHITYDPTGGNPVFLDRLSHIYQNVQAVELRCNYPQIVSGSYIAALLESTSQSNVRAINIVGGLFGLYGHARNTQQVRVDNIKELKFKTTTIGFRHVLLLLSNDPSYLHCLGFDSCAFMNTDNIIDIDMINTGVGTLHIKHNDAEIEIAIPFMLLYVDLQDQNMSKYYKLDIHDETKDFPGEGTGVDDGSNNGITQTTFEDLKTAMGQNARIVSIQLKSLDKLVLNLSINNIECRFTFLFSETG